MYFQTEGRMCLFVCVWNKETLVDDTGDDTGDNTERTLNAYIVDGIVISFVDGNVFVSVFDVIIFVDAWDEVPVLNPLSNCT